MQTTTNPRTEQQNRHLHWLFNQLGVKSKEAISEIVWEHTNHRTHHTSELEFIECMELIRSLESLRKTPRPTQAERIDNKPEDDPERVQLDRQRKGLIKAIFAWCELQGKVVTMDYVKRIACSASGQQRFNDISPAMLTRLYAEFCKKQYAVTKKREMYQPFSMN